MIRSLLLIVLGLAFLAASMFFVSPVSPYKRELVDGAWVISRDWAATWRHAILPNGLFLLGLATFAVLIAHLVKSAFALARRSN